MRVRAPLAPPAFALAGYGWQAVPARAMAARRSLGEGGPLRGPMQPLAGYGWQAVPARAMAARRSLGEGGAPSWAYAAALKSPSCASSARRKAGRAVQR